MDGGLEKTISLEPIYQPGTNDVDTMNLPTKILYADDPAFPHDMCHPGLTKRELIAAIIQAGYCSNSFLAKLEHDSNPGDYDRLRVANKALKEADALIEVINKTTP